MAKDTNPLAESAWERAKREWPKSIESWRYIVTAIGLDALFAPVAYTVTSSNDVGSLLKMGAVAGAVVIGPIIAAGLFLVALWGTAPVRQRDDARERVGAVESERTELAQQVADGQQRSPEQMQKANAEWQTQFNRQQRLSMLHHVVNVVRNYENRYEQLLSEARASDEQHLKVHLRVLETLNGVLIYDLSQFPDEWNHFNSQVGAEIPAETFRENFLAQIELRVKRLREIRERLNAQIEKAQ